MIDSAIKRLIEYGVGTGLISDLDKTYITNSLLQVLKKDDYIDADEDTKTLELEEILGEILEYASKIELFDGNSIVNRDLFDTKVMGILVPRPSEIIKNFYELYKLSPKTATDYFYKLSQDSDYIRRYRITKDIKWITDTEYGPLDVTINLSKPEKDPKEIAAAKDKKQVGYPKCLLCKESEGYVGGLNYPARQNHRIIPIEINNQDWGFQYSPYVYYNEHCIVFNSQHIPMKIDQDTFRKLFDFVKLFPHYFVGSNADLPIVGGSILTHDHFQGGNYEFPMAKAVIEKHFEVLEFADIEVGIVKWPMSVIRARSKDENRLIEFGNHVLEKWRAYTDESSFIFAFSDNEPHNTITPIARKTKDIFELDLVLRNNKTTPLHPYGVFHPHEELHNIKKENIGLIEVMGLAVLPSRLSEEMLLIEDYMLSNKDILSNEKIAKHYDWINDFIIKYPEISESNIRKILMNEIGIVFSKVLEHAGVYKRNVKGQIAFEKFIFSL